MSTSLLSPSWPARCASVIADSLWRTFSRLCRRRRMEQSAWFTQACCLLFRITLSHFLSPVINILTALRNALI